MNKEYTFTTMGSDTQPITLTILPDTYETRKICDLAYSKAYALYLKEGCLTNAQAIKQLKENGAIDPGAEEKIDQLNIQILALLAEAKKLTDKKKKTKADKTKIEQLTAQVKLIRAEIHDITQAQVEGTASTCETKAADRRIEMALVQRLVDADGNHVYKDHRDYVDKIDEPYTHDAFEHMLYLDAGMPFRLEGIYPEDQLLSKEV